MIRKRVVAAAAVVPDPAMELVVPAAESIAALVTLVEKVMFEDAIVADVPADQKICRR